MRQVRIGIHKNADDAFIYIDGGIIRNKLHRNLSAIGWSAEAKYDANIIEIGGDVQLQKGSHDKDVSASVMLRKVW